MLDSVKGLEIPLVMGIPGPHLYRLTAVCRYFEAVLELVEHWAKTPVSEPP